MISSLSSFTILARLRTRIYEDSSDLTDIPLDFEHLSKSLSFGFENLPLLNIYDATVHNSPEGMIASP